MAQENNTGERPALCRVRSKPAIISEFNGLILNLRTLVVSLYCVDAAIVQSERQENMLTLRELGALRGELTEEDADHRRMEGPSGLSMETIYCKICSMDWFTGGGRAGEARRLAAQLSDPDRRDHAAAELIRLGAQAAPALIETLGGGDAGPRQLAAQILVRIGPSSVPPLCQALTQAHPEIRGRAAEILGRLRQNESVPALLEALRGEYYTVRARAATALGQIREPQTIPVLTAALTDAEPEVRVATALALAKFADPNTFEAISNLLLDDPQIEVRQAAAQALGETRRAEAIPYLMEALHDSFWWYEREQSVAALLDAIEKMGRNAVPHLLEALKDAEGAVRRYAATLLSHIPDERAIEPLGMALYDTHFDICRAAAEALAAIGAPALQVLLEALGHPEAWIRQQAVIGLSKIPDAHVAPALLNLLNDENREVREQVIQALGLLGDRRALSPLQDLAASRADRRMAALAKQAIEAINSK